MQPPNNETTRSNILQKIHIALQSQTEQPYTPEEQADFYTPNEQDPLSVFVERFVQNGGIFLLCNNDTDCARQIAQLALAQAWQNPCCRSTKWVNLLQQEGVNTVNELLPHTPAGITPCVALVAQTGSILITSGTEMGRALTVFPPAHIVIAYAGQLVYGIEQALDRALTQKPRELPSMIGLISGPARTADIEKTLVLGAHGPKALYLFLIENKPDA